MLPFSTKHSSYNDSIENELDSEVSGKDSKFERLKGTGDIQGLCRFIIATGDMLNSADQARNVSENATEARRKKRMQV